MLGTFAANSFAQLWIASPADSVRSALHSQTVIVQGPAGQAAELLVNGTPSMKETFRVDGIIDFIDVKVPEGPVRLEVHLLGPDGSTVITQTRSIHVFGAPSSIDMQLESKTITADGKTKIKGTVKLYDRWNYQLEHDLNISVSADSGSITTKDIDPTTKGTQIAIKNGVAEFEYQAGPNPGTDVIRSWYGEVSASTEMGLTTPLESFSLVGLVTGTGGMYQAKGDMTGVASTNNFQNGISGEGRVAAYARGTIGDGYLMTASYDSDRRNSSKFFQDINPDYLYTIYGDNSMLTRDVQSNRNLFVKVEKDLNYVSLGDFTTDIGRQEFTQYNRTLNGVKANVQGERWKAAGFGSLTDRKQAQVEIRGEGISGYYYLGHTDVTQGTDQIRIEIRDKYRSEVLLKRTEMYRFTDYEIDYAQGTLYFKQPVPAIDPAGNPVFIVAAFEATSGTASSYVAGGRVEGKPFDILSLGMNGIVEQQEPANYWLYGGDVKFQPLEAFSLGGEFARSVQMNGSGLAYKVESNLNPFKTLGLKGYYRKVEDGFLNITQSGGHRELGTEKYGVGGSYRYGSFLSLTSDYYQSHQEQSTGQQQLQSFAAALETRFTDRFAAKAKFEDMQSASTDSLSMQPATHSSIGSLATSYRVSERLGVSLEHERNLGSSQDISRPDGTSLVMEYKPFDNVSISANHKFVDGGGSLTTIGAASNITEGTQVTAKYEIGNLVSGQRNDASIGLRNQIKITEEIIGSASYEQSKSFVRRVGEIGTQDHYAASLGLEYLPKIPLKLSGKVEFSNDYRTKKTNYSFGGDYRFANDLGVLIKYRLAEDALIQSNGFHNTYQFVTGLTYRPVESNNFNAIAKIEIRRDNNQYISPALDSYASIASVHAYLEPVRRLELGVKTAFKLGNDVSAFMITKTQTVFALLDLSYDLTETWSFRGEYRVLHQVEANDLLTGYNVGVGYAIARNLLLTGGYNFKGYREPDLVDYSLWSQGPFVTFSFKFDQDMFGVH
jgi:hypothetical protein